MKHLIVNADDFGLTSGVNRAVIEGHCHGIITSTTVMVNMPGFDEAARLAREHPSLGVGLHFNMTQGRPTAPVSQVLSLTDGHGEFLQASSAALWRALKNELRADEVAIELRAQIEKALTACVRLTHVDGHQHAQAWPQVFEAIADVLPEYGIRAVRLPRERLRWPGAHAPIKVFKQTAVAGVLARLCIVNAPHLTRAGLRSPEAFFSIARTGFWTKRWLMDVIESLPEGISELMCHPGYEDAALAQAQTRLRASRAVELKLLTDPDIAALIRERGIRLIDYSQLETALRIKA